MKYFGWVLALILLPVLAYFILHKPEPESVYLDRVVTKVDTIMVIDYLEQDTVFVEKEVTVHDTIFITTAGDSIKTEVARLDTTFQDSAELSIAYFIAPRVYDVRYLPAPIKRQTITREVLETVYVDSSAWWDKAWVGGVGGAVFTALIVSLVK